MVSYKSSDPTLKTCVYIFEKIRITKESDSYEPCRRVVVPVVRSPLAIRIEMAKATSAAMDEKGSSVEAAPATCDDTVIEWRADGAGATEAARKLE